MEHPEPNRHLLLRRAIGLRDKNTVKNLLQESVGVDEVQLNYNDLLHSAIIIFNDSEIIAMLLDAGADIHDKDEHDRTPLHVAIQHHKTDAASFLIEKGALVGEDLNLLLLEAIEKNNETIVKMIIDYGMQNKLSINLITHLKTAISQGHSKMIEAIIFHCGFLELSDIRSLSDRNNFYPRCENCREILSKRNLIFHPDNYHDEDFIYKAVEYGDVSIVMNLLEHGFDINMVNSKTGLTLLTVACLKKHHEIIETFLEYNVNEAMGVPKKDNKKIINQLLFYSSNWFGMSYDSKIKDNGKLFNLTCIATKNDDVEAVKKFLKQGVQTADFNTDVKTLLHFCVRIDHSKRDSSYNVAKLLLEKGADIHLKTPNNKFVYKAVENKHRKIAQLFLDYNADVQYISPRGDTSLHAAIKNGFDAEFIKTLLKLNSPVNTVDCNGQTPLLDACINKTKDQLEIIEALLHHNADVNRTNRRLKTPLHCVIYDDNEQIIKALLNKGANPNARDTDGRTPLHYVCIYLSGTTVSKIRLLLEHGADIEAVDGNGWTPLFVAINHKNHVALKSILDNHANFNVVDMHGYSPFHFACTSDNWNPETIKVLLQYDFNIESRDRHGWTPLSRACDQRYYPAVKCLLENHADPNALNDKGETPLHIVCKFRGNVTISIIQSLLEHGANIEAVDGNGWTPLFVACKHNNLNAVKYLLDNHANRNAIDNHGQTLLHIACKYYDDWNSKLIQSLLQYNLNVESKNNQGWTPLLQACEEQCDSAIEYLLKIRANPNVTNSKGETPLHIVCKRNDSEHLIPLLLKHGASIKAVDHRGWTPLCLACHHYNYRTLKCLLIHRANPNHTDFENLTPLHIAFKLDCVPMKSFCDIYPTIQRLLEYGAKIDVLDRSKRTALHYAVEKMIHYNNNLLANVSGHKNYSQFTKILISQGIKLKAADFDVMNHKSNVVFNCDDYITIDDIKYSANDILQLNVASDSNDVSNNDAGVSNYEHSIGDLRKLKVKCEQEIEKMKTESIGIDDLTFYDLLKEDVYCLSGLVKNEKVQAILETESYDKEFPLYIDMVRSRLRDANIHHELLICREYFRLKIYERLPDDCIDEILNNLTIEEIQKFIEAMETLNGQLFEVEPEKQ